MLEILHIIIVLHLSKPGLGTIIFPNSYPAVLTYTFQSLQLKDTVKDFWDALTPRVFHIRFRY